jgi:hypothetical protein
MKTNICAGPDGHVIDYIGGHYPYECVNCGRRYCAEDLDEMAERAMREADARAALTGIEPEYSLYIWENSAQLNGTITAEARRTCERCGNWANHIHPAYDEAGRRCPHCHGSGYNPDEVCEEGEAPVEPCPRCGGNAMDIQWRFCTIEQSGIPTKPQRTWDTLLDLLPAAQEDTPSP